eukprot:762521-Hanusia_phi.AAC.11
MHSWQLNKKNRVEKQSKGAQLTSKTISKKKQRIMDKRKKILIPDAIVRNEEKYKKFKMDVEESGQGAEKAED